MHLGLADDEGDPEHLEGRLFFGLLSTEDLWSPINLSIETSHITINPPTPWEAGRIDASS